MPLDLSFVSVTVHKRGEQIAFVTATGLTEPFVTPAIAFALAFAEVALIMDITDYQMTGAARYWVAQVQDGPADLEWVRNALNRLESGWTLHADRLCSPDESRLSEAAVRDTLANGCAPPPPPAPVLPPAKPKFSLSPLAAAIAGAVIGLTVGGLFSVWF